MRVFSVLQVASVIFLYAFSLTTVYATPLDFSGDGHSDILFRRKAGSQSSWRYFSPQTGVEGSIASFAKKKSVAVPGFWESLDTPSLAVIETTGKKKKARHSWLLRTSNGGTRRINFGSGNVDFISGADFNGNGYLDAAVVLPGGRIEILTDPFAPDTDPAVNSNVTIQQFSKNGRTKLHHFFTRGSSEAARAATLGRIKRDGVHRYEYQQAGPTGALSITTIPGFATRAPVQVQTLLSGEGEDVLLIVSDQKFLTEENRRRKEVTVLSLDGRVLYRGRYSRKATIVTGDYIAEAGEEFAVVLRKRIIVVNPFGETVRTFPGFPGEAVGTVLTPSEKANAAKQSGPCDKFLPAPDGPNNFLAKNADHGGVVYLTPDGSYRNGKILHPKTLKEISGTRYTGVANGGRGHFRIGGSLPFGEHVFSAETGNETHCWRIPDGMSRVD